jgi:hypothetical protein
VFLGKVLLSGLFTGELSFKGLNLGFGGFELLGVAGTFSLETTLA